LRDDTSENVQDTFEVGLIFKIVKFFNLELNYILKVDKIL